MDFSYRTLKERLEGLEDFLKNVESSESHSDIKQQLESINYLSGVVDFISGYGEEVKEEEHSSFVDEELGQIAQSSHNYSCQPTFIIGMRRSGTTLLSALLDSHSQFCSIPENFMLQNMMSSDNLKAICEKAYRSLEISPEIFWANQTKVIDNLYLEFMKYTESNKKRWFTKELFSANNLDKIDYIFNYQAKFIYIVRNGFDVSYSCAKRFPERGNFLHQGNYLKGYLREWVDNNELTMDFYERNPERCYLIKYEELTQNPETELIKLFKFLGEDYEPDLLDKMKTEDHHGVTGDHKIYSTGFEVQKGRGANWQDWPEPIKQQLFKMAESTLRRLNYI